MRKIFAVVVFVSFAFSLRAGDVTATAKSFSDCVSIALANSIEYRIQSETLDRANLERLKAVGGLLPDISLNHYRYYGYDTGLSDNGWASTISASQPVFYGFSKLFSISRMDRLAVREEWNLAKLKKTVAEDTADAYYGLASALADLYNTREASRIMEERIVELKQREALGKSRLSELYSAQARGALLKAQLKQAEAAAEAAKDKLEFTLNAEIGGIIQPSDPASQEAGTASGDAAQDQPEVKALEAAIEAESGRINGLHSAFLPQVDLSVEKEIGASAYGNGPYEIVLMAKWPLFTGGARVIDAMEGYSSERALKQEKALLMKTILSDIRSKNRNYAASVERVKALKEAYDRSLDSYKLMQKDYRYGMASNIEVMQAMADMTDIKASYDREVVAREKSMALLLIMTGAAEAGK